MPSHVIFLIFIYVSPCLSTLYVMYLSAYKVIGLSVYVLKMQCARTYYFVLLGFWL